MFVILWLYIKNIPDSGYQIRLTKIVVRFGDNDVDDHDDGSGGDDGDEGACDGGDMSNPFLMLLFLNFCISGAALAN
jgi:hypothetical protein